MTKPRKTTTERKRKSPVRKSVKKTTTERKRKSPVRKSVKKTTTERKSPVRKSVKKTTTERKSPVRKSVKKTTTERKRKSPVRKSVKKTTTERKRKSPVRKSVKKSNKSPRGGGTASIATKSYPYTDYTEAANWIRKRITKLEIDQEKEEMKKNPATTLEQEKAKQLFPAKPK